jgi:GC-rich sequence DNA-binding factor
LENLNSDSEDEETKRWEEEQINKGMKASNVQPLEEVTFDSFDPLMQSMITGNQYHHDSKRLTTPKPLNIKFIPITLENWRAKLEVKLKEAKDSLNDHKKQLEQVEADLKDALELASVAESDQPSLEPRYLFYQQMKGYLQDLLSCLAVKVRNTKSTALENFEQKIYC